MKSYKSIYLKNSARYFCIFSTYMRIFKNICIFLLFSDIFDIYVGFYRFCNALTCVMPGTVERFSVYLVDVAMRSYLPRTERKERSLTRLWLYTERQSVKVRALRLSLFHTCQRKIIYTRILCLY